MFFIARGIVKNDLARRNRTLSTSTTASAVKRKRRITRRQILAKAIFETFCGGPGAEEHNIDLSPVQQQQLKRKAERSSKCGSSDYREFGNHTSSVCMGIPVAYTGAEKCEGNRGERRDTQATEDGEREKKGDKIEIRGLERNLDE